MILLKSKIKRIFYASMIALAIGLITVLLFFVLFLHFGQLPFNSHSLTLLYRQYDILYLVNLIPLLFLAGGVFIGSRIANHEDRLKQKINVQNAVIKKTARFVQEIGKGNFQYNLASVNGENILSEALYEMRENLIKTQNEEVERKIIAEIKSEISDILRAQTDLHKLSQEITAYLVKKLDNVVQGAFYLVQEENQKKPTIDLMACYAFDRKKYAKKSLAFGEGLVGQAVLEKDHVFRTEIPKDYPSVISGLIRKKKPQSILIEPLIYEDKVYGVIELVALVKFSPLQLRILREISPIIAITVNNVKMNEKTYLLLQQSQKMSKELSVQKQKLEENAELMISTQEELKESNIKLEEQIQQVHDNQKKTNILLENNSEILYIVTEKGDVQYISPSVKNILGYNPQEILKKPVVDNIHPQDIDPFKKMLQNLLSFPEKTQVIQYRYFTKNGESTWLESIGKNMLSNPVINGIILNSRDISLQRLAVKEQRIRAKMQALSENSPDIIIRIDIFTRCTYVNPVVETFTLLKPEDFINKPLMDIQIDEKIKQFWKQLLDEIVEDKHTKSGEMMFPTPEGTKFMQINAIPEFYDHEELESVLFVCHDITEAKQREEVIKQKNQSISDSINYAYYIQSSLMPTEKQVREYLPNSFMFYRPKDVVSGDYPWFSVNGDDLYIGAMDCTGHGVPGALMSLIGYFSQNEILLKDNSLNAGKILDSLHQNVVKTLRQDEEESKTKDGMDAAFCKINLKKSELHFAGAHRPMYYVSNGVFEEIKGDRFPVGGMHHKKRTNFTNHTIHIKPGDALYIMTDGLPDQFGGPDGKQKLMSGRIKNIIKDHTHLSIFQMGNLFRRTYYDWKGNTKQLDDVLVIGIKF